MSRNSSSSTTHGPLPGRAQQVMFIKLVAAGVTYGFSIILARVMAPDQFGYVAMFLNSALFLSVVGSRGHQIAALRFTPELSPERVTDSLQVFFSWSLRHAAFGVLLVSILALSIALVITCLNPGNATPPLVLVLGFCLIPLVGWVDLLSHFARSLNLIRLSFVPKEILWRLLAGLAVISLYLQSNHAPVSALEVLVALLAALGAICILQTIALSRMSGLHFSLGKASQPVGSVGRSTTNSFWVTSVSNIFLANVDVLVVGVFIGIKQAGLYFAANRLAMLLAFIQTSYYAILGPALSHAWQTDGRAETGRLARQTARKTTGPTVCFALILGWFAPEVLTLFGPEYATAGTALRWLLLAGVVNCAFGPGDIALNMCGQHKRAMQASIASTGLAAPLLVFGAVAGGATGVAAAVLCATSVRKLAYWWLALRTLAMRTDAFAQKGSVPLNFVAT